MAERLLLEDEAAAELRGIRVAPPAFVQALRSIALPSDVRRPDRTELEFTTLAFAALVPVGYYMRHFLFGLMG